MRLSMWTICEWLEKKGLDVSPSISEGLPRITSFRYSKADSYSARFVEIVPPENVSGAEADDVVLANDMDYILVHKADAIQVGNHLSEAFEFYTQWENLLFTRMIEGASLQEMLDAANAVFSRPMFIKNDSSWIFAITRGYPADVHPYWAKMESSIGKYTADFDTVRTVSTDPVFRNIFMEKYPTVNRSPAYGAMILHANIFLDDRRVAEIIALENGVPFGHGEVHLMHIFAELVEKYIRSNADILISVSDPAIFLGALIEKRTMDESNLPLIYQSLYLLPESELCVAVIEGKNRSDTPMLGVLRDELTGQLKDAVVFSYKNQVVCLLALRNRSYEAAIRQMRALVPQDAFIWGASYEFVGLKELAIYYEQACAALDKAEQQGKTHATLYAVACECISQQLLESEKLLHLIHPDVLRLKKADEQENAQYSLTLFQFLLCGGNYTDTATRMGLHRNSLIYRMNKIRSIIHTNLDDMENRELLIFSYMLLGRR